MTIKEAAALEGVNYFAFHKRCLRGKYKTYREHGTLKIPVSSLSPQAQKKYWTVNEDTHRTTIPHIDIQNLSKEKRDNYLRKLQIIKEAPKGDARDLTKYLKEKGVSRAAFYEWKRKLKKEGAEALLDGRGGRPRELNPADEAALAYLYLKPSRPSITQVYRQFLSLWDKNCGRPCPSTHQARRFLKSLPEATKFRYRHGIGAYKNFAEIFAERDYTSLLPNEFWTSDHTQIDVAVRDPFTGRALFPWITIIMDVRSRKILGYFVGHTPSGRTIAAALGRALKHCKPPKRAILDNGMDYRSRYISGGQVRLKKGRIEVDRETKGILTALHIDVQWTIVKNAQSKPCERWFRRMKEEFCRILPGYRGGRIWERPEGLQKVLKSGRLLSLTELDALLARWIDDYNNSPHRGHGMDDKFPNEVYVVKKSKLVNPDTLTLLLMPFTRRKVCRNGIKFMGATYYAAALENIRGHSVDIRWDPQEMGRIASFDLKGAFICWAEHQPRVSFKATEEDIKNLQAKKKASRKLHGDFYREITERLETPNLLKRIVATHQATKNVQPTATSSTAKRFSIPEDSEALKLKIARELPPWEAAGGVHPRTRNKEKDEKFYLFECEREEDEEGNT